MSDPVRITTPPGRIVMGSLYKPNTTDAEGKPLIVKTGPNAGKPRVDYFFALAIPKGAETHWSQTSWGAKIWAVGHAAFPQAAQSPAFAWKIEDGDSAIPNKKGRKPCETEGCPKHWILKLSGGFAPKVYQVEGAGFVQVMTEDFVKCGYWVEVYFSVEGNSSASQPGVYLNHSMVCLRARDKEIVMGADPSMAGFGAAPLPPGLSLTPPPGAMPPPATPGIPPAPGYPVPGVPVPVPVPPAAPMPIPVVPNPQYVQVPPPAPAAPVPVPVPVPPPAPAAPVRQMTAAANGVAYEAYIAQGWTDALLIQHGMMVP